MLLDSRLTPVPKIDPKITVLSFSPTLLGRLRAELALRSLTQPQNDILCFGNLPPLLSRAEANTSIFLQNRYLIPPSSFAGLPWKTTVRLWIERIWLARRRGAARLIVQSETMASAVIKAFNQEPDIYPFTPQLSPASKAEYGSKSLDFLYVASGEAHKNHITLLAAWERLAMSGLKPSLGLTLSACDAARFEAPLRSARSAGAMIELLPLRSAEEMPELYASARAAIYPSLFESFGLPLIEAKAAGLPIIAAERDYVRDLVDPVETFDPTSENSIARAVRRYLRQPTDRIEILNAKGLLVKLRQNK
ncbi:glycosyltransferase [Roseicyclus marinus]